MFHQSPPDPPVPEKPTIMSRVATSLVFMVANVLIYIGVFHMLRKDLDAALKYHERALAIQERVAPYCDSEWRASVLSNISLIHRQRGSLDAALMFHERAIAVGKRAKPGSLDVASDPSGVVLTHMERGELDTALKYLEQAFESDQSTADASMDVNDRLDAASDLNGIGVIHQQQGDLDMALKHYELAHEITQKIAPNSSEMAVVLSSIGAIHQQQGDLDMALKHYELALKIVERIAGDPLVLANILSRVGVIHQQRGIIHGRWDDLNTALKYQKRALKIIKRIAPNSIHMADVFNNIGLIYTQLGLMLGRQGGLFRALEYQERSLTLVERIAPNSLWMANALGCIGYTYTRLGLMRGRQRDQDIALEYQEQSLTLVERIAPNSMQMIATLSSIGAIHQRRGEVNRSIPVFERVLDVMDWLRRHAGGATAAQGALQEYGPIYLSLSSDLYDRSTPGDHERAFFTLERFRSRSMLERLAEGNLLPRAATEAHTPAQRELLNREASLRLELARSYSQQTAISTTSGLNSEADRAVTEAIRELEQKQDRLVREMRASFPEYADLQYPQPLSLAEVQRDVLDPGTLYVAYEFIDECCLVYTIRQTDYALTATSESVEALTALVEAAVGRFQRTEEAVAASGIDAWERIRSAEEQTTARLSAALFSSIPARLWRGVTRVIISADGALHYLPFEMLPWDGAALGDQFPITYAPSATVLKSIRDLTDRRPAPDDGKRFIGFADPDSGPGTEPDGDKPEERGGTTLGPFRAVRDGSGTRLPGARQEVVGIATSMGGAARGAASYFGAEATERRVFEEVYGYRWVHFATHGSYDENNPMNGFLLLAHPAEHDPDHHDHLLTVRDIFRLKLNADIVVCSACVTALGQLDTAEGVIGLSRAFFYAGAKAVVATLWPVDDTATRAFMECFYQFLNAEEAVSPAVALKNARLEMRRAYDDPYHWAPFILIGLG